METTVNGAAFLAASGLVACPLPADEEPCMVIQKIEELVYTFVYDMIEGRKDGALMMITRTSANVHEDDLSGALLLGTKVSIRRFNERTAGKVAQLFEVLTLVNNLLQHGKRISQREMFYLLVESFSNQAQLNDTILDVSATLGVPRFALNVGAATRGVLAGSLQLATPGSLCQVDCQYVGTNGWPIPGDVRMASSIVVHSTARYIIVIEKFGIFSRLVQDRFYEKLPCILVCGRGYPSIATRAVTSLLEKRLRIPVLGLADFNPHGLALLQCYRRGSIRSSLEGSRFVCNLRWLGLRSSHILQHGNLGTRGEPLTARDEAVLRGLLRTSSLIRLDARYKSEVELMRRVGKFELQWLYGHADGVRFFSEGFLLGAILRGDYL